MKIALIQPDMPSDCPIARISPQVPLGLCYLVSYIQQFLDCDIKIFDSYLHHQDSAETAKQVLKFNADIAGISTTSMSIPEARKIAKKLKEENKEMNIVLGGPHATIFPRQVISLPYIDAAVVGEGEITFREYVEAYINHTSFSKVKGVMIKKNNKVFFTGRRNFIPNLDVLPFPARGLIDIKKYYRRGDALWVYPVDTVNTSRGCPYNCLFCSSSALTFHTYRARSPPNVVDEIEHLTNKFGTKGIYFREDNFTCNETRVLGICRELKKREISIQWECESRVKISKPLLKEMKSAGCKTIWFGIESGSQKILNYLRKGATIDQIKKTVKNCKEIGINVGASFMIGVPTETINNVKSTIKLWKELNANFSWFSEYVAMPGSELYEIIKKNRDYKKKWEDIFLVETPELSRTAVKNYLKKVGLEERRRNRKTQLIGMLTHPRYGLDIGIRYVKRKLGCK